MPLSDGSHFFYIYFIVPDDHTLESTVYHQAVLLHSKTLVFSTLLYGCALDF